MKTKSIIKRLLRLGIEEKDIIREPFSDRSIRYSISIGDSYIRWWHTEETGDAITLSIKDGTELHFFDTIADMIDYAIGSGLVEAYKKNNQEDYGRFE
jgi:hypothetical protein